MTHRTARRIPATRVTGVVVSLLALVVLAVAWGANRGLPFEDVREVTVVLPSANRLAATNDVRIAGVRVGQVKEVDAVPGAGGEGPAARATLKLEPSVGELPVDSVVKVRPASILGTSYLDLTLGAAERRVPWGGTLPLERAQSTVDLTDLLDIFDRETARSTQETLSSLGDGLAGRGPALNTTLARLAELLGPLRRVSRVLAAPSTGLGRLVDEYGTFVAALEPVSRELGGLVAGAGTTFGALARESPSLAAAIRAAAPAERATTTGLTRLQPSLDGLADMFADVRPAVRRLPAALRAGTGAITAGTPALRALPDLTAPLDATLGELGRRSRDPATSGALRKAGELVTAAQVTLEKLTPAQVQCNIISLFAQSFGTAYGTVGAKEGPPMAFVGETHLGAIGESMQNAAPSSGVAINVNPRETYDECESGNEEYPYGSLPIHNRPGPPVLGNTPAREPARTLDTYPPAGVHDRARQAGVLPLLSEEAK